MSIRDIFSKYKNLASLNAENRNTQLPGGYENLCCELYNPGTELNQNKIGYTLKLDSIHPQKHLMNFFGKGPEFWNMIKCEPGEWVFLPHGLYMPTYWRNGQEDKGVLHYNMIMNFGDGMFKGNKLPSRPDVKEVRSYRLKS